MWKKLKRPLAFVLTLAMLVSLANFEQFSVLAEGAPETTTTAAESKTSDKAKEKTTENSEKAKEDSASEKQTAAEKKESGEAKSEDKSEENKEKASESETEAAPESTTGKKEEGTFADKKEDGTSEKKEDGTSEKKEDEKETAFSSEKTTDDITVKAEAEKGVLPDGTQMELTYVGTKSDSVDNAFKEKEITTDNYIAVKAVFSKDGKEVTPDGKVKMTITMPESKLGEKANAESLKMRRIKKSDDKTDIDTMAVYNADSEATITVKDKKVKAEFNAAHDGTFVYTWDEKEEAAEEFLTTATAAYDKYTVTVTCDEKAAIPANAELVVKESDQETDAEDLAQIINEGEESKIEKGKIVIQPEVETVVSLDISFMLDGKEIEPAEGSSVKVEIKISDDLKLEDGQELNVIHHKDDKTSEVVDDLKVEEGKKSTDLTFSTESFSTFTITREGKANVVITSVEINDKIKTDGIYELKLTAEDGTTYTGEEAAALLKEGGYTVEWTKSGETIEYKQITLTNGKKVYTTEPNGGWVNVAYTSGAGATYTVTVKNGDGVEESASASVSYTSQLENGSFETQSSGVKYNDGDNSADTVPNWSTTDLSNHIEIVQPSSGSYYYVGNSTLTVPDGTYCAEINANGTGALYQDVMTVPGQSMNWQFYHRARTFGYLNNGWRSISSGSDTMAMIIAPTDLVENITTQTQLTEFYATLTNKNGANTVTKTLDDGTVKTYTVYVYEDSAAISSGSSSWIERTGTITVPDDQYVSRFFFMAVDTASGNVTMGNLVDNVWFSQELPDGVKSGTATIDVVKKISGLTAKQAEEAFKDKTFITAGGQAVTFTDWTDQDGYAVSNTQRVTISNLFGTFDTNASEDTGEAKVDGYDLSETTVQVDSGETKNANTTSLSIEKNATKTVTFTNTYTPSKANITVKKTIVDKGLDGTDLAGLKEKIVFEAQKENSTDKSNVVTTTTDGWVKGTTTEGDKTYDTYTYQYTTTDKAYDVGSSYTVTESSYDIGESGEYTITANPQSVTKTIKTDADQNVFEFTNTYERKSYKVTILKHVTGNMGEKNKDFTFTASGDDVAIADQSFTLKDNTVNTDSKQEITVPYGSEVTITEDDYSGDDYTLESITAKKGDAVDSSAVIDKDKRTCTVTVKGDVTIEYTNDKNAVAPTAMVTNYTPYILAVGGALALFAVMMAERSRRRGKRNRY